MNFREFKGKTLDEAKENACAYFNTREEYLTYEIIKKKKGSSFDVFSHSEVVIKARPKGEKDEAQKTPEPNVKKPLSDEAKNVVLEVEELLKRTGFEFRLNSEEDDEGLKVGIFGPSMKGLIQEEGAGIDSLKHLITRISIKKKIYNKRVRIDINDYQKEKEQYIKKLAQRLSEKAKRTRKEVIANTMNAYDRRIFHLEVEAIDGVETKSIGEGLYKKIKVIPR